MRRPPRTLWTVKFRCPAEKAEGLTSLVEDALAVTVLAPPRQPRATIEAIYGDEPNRGSLLAQLTILSLVHGIQTPDLVIEEVPNLDWLQKVSEDFPPLKIARWTVYGALHKKSVLDPRYGLEIDATSAFGTGEHPTTRGCLIALDRLLKRFKPLQILDMGCGSGILAMAAIKSRCGHALGIDLDHESIGIAHNNAIKNGLQARMRLKWGDGYRSVDVQRNGPYDLILANIFAGPLSQMAKSLRRHLKPGGYVILSGLLQTQANRVIAAHHLQHIYLEKHIRLGEWSVLALRHRSRAR